MNASTERTSLEQIAIDLLRATSSGRVTVRVEDEPGSMPVVAEAAAAGVASLVGKPTVPRTGSAPGPLEVIRDELRVIVQADVRTSPPEFPELAELYGIRAQMLAPLVDGGRLRGILSVHSVETHSWTQSEIAALERAAADVVETLGW